MIILKTYDAINNIIKASAVANNLLTKLGLMLKEGISTIELDKFAEDYIKSNGCSPTFKGYKGYKHTIATSVNDVVLHGVPSSYKLKAKDIISVDVGVNYKGWNADTADTYCVDGCDIHSKNIIGTTRRALNNGINKCVF